MCGIAGILSFSNSSFQITEKLLIEMRDTMVHRGPDDEGLWLAKDRKVGLAHRRLSIIDLSDSASQPMCNEDGSIWLTFNGEIYNHVEIRQELEKLGGHRWKTDHSDTEVILHAFEQWGIACIKKFRGMFAFALWDSRKEELWLVRDRIGIKPLYYSFHNGRITFASEIKALMVDPDQKRELNYKGLFNYLSYLVTPAPDTLFEGVHKLSPATCLKIRRNGLVHEFKFWDVWENVTPLTGISEQEITERVLHELRVSVNLRKVGDVPLGVFLSGGLDSSINAALFSESNDMPVNTFSIGYDDEYPTSPNELKYARLAAVFIKANHFEHILTEENLLDILPTMIHHQDEPIADKVCVPIYYVSKLARDNNVKVCQVGEGADELFCGYPSWIQRINLQKINDAFPFSLPQKLGVSILNNIPVFRNNFRTEWLRRGGSGYPIFWSGAEAFTPAHKFKLIHDDVKKKIGDQTSYEAIAPIRQRFENDAWQQTPLQWMTYMDLNLRLPELLLMRIDKMSMAVSLECRVPFLDHKFVELALSIPEEIKIKNGNLKGLLKKAAKGLIPDELIYRKKQGFSVPVYEWFSGRLGNSARDKLISFCDKTNFFNKNEVLRLMGKGQRARLWYLLNFSMWWEEWFL